MTKKKNKAFRAEKKSFQQDGYIFIFSRLTGIEKSIMAGALRRKKS
jgi:hypothetical protein